MTALAYTRQDVAEGQRLVAELGRSQWALGDLALRVAPMGADHTNNGSGELLAEFADEIGISAETLREYRKIAAAWPDGARAPSASYTLHRELASHPKRVEVLAAYLDSTIKPSYRGLQKFLGKRPTPEITAGNREEQVRQALTEMPAGERAALVTEALADPEVADKVVADRDTRRSFNTADDRRVEEGLRSAGTGTGDFRRHAEKERDKPLAFSGWMATITDLDLLRIKRDLRRIADELSRLGGPMPEAYREDILGATSHMRVSLDFIDAVAQRGNTDWDAALAGLRASE